MKLTIKQRIDNWIKQYKARTKAPAPTDDKIRILVRIDELIRKGNRRNNLERKARLKARCQALIERYKTLNGEA